MTKLAVREPTLRLKRRSQALALLRLLRSLGARCVSSAISHHGSDCPIDEDDAPVEERHHKRHPGSRCIHAYRLRLRLQEPTRYQQATTLEGDWIVLVGDWSESQAFEISGPYGTAPLYYGGGFWEKVEF